MNQLSYLIEHEHQHDNVDGSVLILMKYRPRTMYSIVKLCEILNREK